MDGDLKKKFQKKNTSETSSPINGLNNNCGISYISKAISQNQTYYPAMICKEQKLSHDDRIRRAFDINPYLFHIKEIFCQRLSDSSDSEDDITEKSPFSSHLSIKAENDSRVPGISEAINTLNINLADEKNLPGVTSAPFLPFSSSPQEDCLFPTSIPPLSPHKNEEHFDLELNKYLERQIEELTDPVPEFRILEFPNSKISNLNNPNLNSSTLSSQAQSSLSSDLSCDSNNKVKDVLSEKVKGSISEKSAIINHLAISNEAESDEVVLVKEEKFENQNEDEDSLSEYMNIPANASIALESYFKFDTDELTSAESSPATSSNSSTAFSQNTDDKKQFPDEKSCSNSSAEITMQKNVGKKISLQKQARLIHFLNLKRRKIYVQICRKEIGRAQRTLTNTYKEKLAQCRKVALAVSKHLRLKALDSEKLLKEKSWRAKLVSRDVQTYWKQSDKAEKELKKENNKKVQVEKEQLKYSHQVIENKNKFVIKGHETVKGQCKRGRPCRSRLISNDLECLRHGLDEIESPLEKKRKTLSLSIMSHSSSMSSSLSVASILENTNSRSFIIDSKTKSLNNISVEDSLECQNEVLSSSLKDEKSKFHLNQINKANNFKKLFKKNSSFQSAFKNEIKFQEEKSLDKPTRSQHKNIKFECLNFDDRVNMKDHEGIANYLNSSRLQDEISELQEAICISPDFQIQNSSCLQHDDIFLTNWKNTNLITSNKTSHLLSDSKILNFSDQEQLSSDYTVSSNLVNNLKIDEINSVPETKKSSMILESFSGNSHNLLDAKLDKKEYSDSDYPDFLVESNILKK